MNMGETIPSHTLSFEAALQNIIQELSPERVILFGSRARGDALPDSDYDLMLICNSLENPLQLAAKALFVARPRRFALDIAVLTPSEFENSLLERNDFVWQAMQHSKVVYEKTNPSLA
jgi:uncharacterized protein